MADFVLVESPKLISRKIWVLEKLWNFHTVVSYWQVSNSSYMSFFHFYRWMRRRWGSRRRSLFGTLGLRFSQVQKRVFEKFENQTFGRSQRAMANGRQKGQRPEFCKDAYGNTCQSLDPTNFCKGESFFISTQFYCKKVLEANFAPRLLYLRA